MSGSGDLALRPVGEVRSPLRDPAEAPKQGDEGAPEARLEMDDSVGGALQGLRVGDELYVLTWLHRADRAVLRVHPRDDSSRPQLGVFATRSQDRPNPIGLHRVEVSAIEGLTLTVRGLEAIDGTPVLDLKPVLSSDAGSR